MSREFLTQKNDNGVRRNRKFNKMPYYNGLKTAHCNG